MRGHTKPAPGPRVVGDELYTLMPNSRERKPQKKPHASSVPDSYTIGEPAGGDVVGLPTDPRLLVRSEQNQQKAAGERARNPTAFPFPTP